MATADLTRLMNDIRVRVPGAVDPVIQQEIFLVVDELLRATDMWQEDIPVAVVANTTNYDLVPSDQGMILRLIQLVDPTLPQVPRAADMQVPGTLVLRVTPTQSYSWTATVSKTVIDPVTRTGYPEFPEWILQKHRPYLVDGALARLYGQPAKPYANQTLAVLHQRRWQAALTNARQDARRFNLFGGQRWSFPGFALGTRQRSQGRLPPQ